MRRIFAIAALAIRSARRSRMVLAVVTMLAVAVVGIPLAIKGDGTVVGRATIILHYMLSVTVFLLSVSTIWVGCCAVAVELRSRRLDLVVTKPVGRFQIWAGNWLALAAVNTVLVAGVGAAAALMITYALRPGEDSPADYQRLQNEVLVARRDADVRLADGETQRSHILIPPQHGHAWHVRLPHGTLAPAHPLYLRYRIASSRQQEQRTVKGVWTVGADPTHPTFRMAVTNIPGRLHQLPLSAAEAGGSEAFVLAYHNTEDELPSTILFGPADGLEVLVYAGGFMGNLVRGLLVILCFLVFLGALGVTAGALMSLPVAVFTSLTFMLVAASAPYVHSVASAGAGNYVERHEHDHGDHDDHGDHAEHGDSPSLDDQLVLAVFVALDHVVAPITGFDPLPRIADGRIVEWRTLGRAAVMFIVVYSGVLGLVGSLLFRRREVAMVET